MVVDIADVVNRTNFGDHRLRGFWVAGGQISPSPIDFHRRPYNTLALPCERVIMGTVACTLSFTKHVSTVLKLCSQCLYLRKLLRDQGNCLDCVFHSLLSRTEYALPVWRGYLNSKLSGQVNMQVSQVWILQCCC